MRKKRVFLFVFAVVAFFSFGFFVVTNFQILSRAAAVKADIVVDVNKSSGFIPYNWKALSQGGEEVGVRMLGNVGPQLKSLSPQFIRLDHIFDIYNVVNRTASGQLLLNFSQLDQTVCDIYASGAKPFFSLSYMPPTMSVDGSLISQPRSWNEWAALVQKTIEHYSGQNTVLCNGTVAGTRLEGLYYEVWNEPDLESFGKWSLYGGSKDYKVLYYYSSYGAANAQNTYQFYLGGPATTMAYKSWMQKFLQYATENRLRVDFLSWHHYSKNPDDFRDDVVNVNNWLSDDEFAQYRTLPKLITEWGFDSNPNAAADTNIGAAHTVTSIMNLIDQNLEYAFAFEVKDGLNPSWGILTHEGAAKPRYKALSLLNNVQRNRIGVTGEGTFVRAIASRGRNKIVLVVSNYDLSNSNTELVPIRFTNLPIGKYRLHSIYIDQQPFTSNVYDVSNGEITTSILMEANSVVVIEVIPEITEVVDITPTPVQ